MSTIDTQKALETATLAGGCFWCLEAAYRQLKGVESVVSGYTGGHVANPAYEEVCGGDPGHAEAVRLRFHPARISTSQDHRALGVEPLL